MTKADKETRVFYNRISLHYWQLRILDALGIKTQKEADRALAMMLNGSSKDDVLYTLKETR